MNSLITDILVLFLWNGFGFTSVPTHVSLRLMSVRSSPSGWGWETHTSLRCTFPSQALTLRLVPARALCRGSFRAVPRPRCFPLLLCGRPGLGARGTAPSAAPPALPGEAHRVGRGRLWTPSASCAEGPPHARLRCSSLYGPTALIFLAE